MSPVLHHKPSSVNVSLVFASSCNQESELVIYLLMINICSHKNMFTLMYPMNVFLQEKAISPSLVTGSTSISLVLTPIYGFPQVPSRCPPGHSLVTCSGPVKNLSLCDLIFFCHIYITQRFSPVDSVAPNNWLMNNPIDVK